MLFKILLLANLLFVLWQCEKSSFMLFDNLLLRQMCYSFSEQYEYMYPM